MGLETATYISQLDAANPLGSDQKSQGDDHLRLIKSAIKNTFPNFGAAALNVSNTQLDKINSVVVVNASAPNNTITIDVNGRLGVSNTTPNYKLDVAETGTSGTAVDVARLYTSAGATAGARLLFGTAALPVNAAIKAVTNSATGGALVVQTSQEGTGALTDRTVWDAYGNVGVNYSPPNYGAGVNTIGISASAQAVYDMNVGGTRVGVVTATASGVNMGSIANVAVNVIQNNATVIGITGGVASYNNFEIGWRDVPRTTAALARGQVFATSGGVTINAVSGSGQTYSIYNDSASPITITQGTATLRLAGSASTGNRTLAARGFATVWYNAAAEAIISGSGVS